MTYTDEFDLLFTEDNDLHKKVARAVDKAARDVANESEATEYHEERYAWALRMRGKVERIKDEAHRYMPYILDNATISAAGNAATDADVQNAVNGIVNLMAGV